MSNRKNFLQRILSGTLAIPNFMEFCEDLIKIFENVRFDNQGLNATYIPILANVDPEKFAFAICSGKFNMTIML
jgi:glutaminase